MAIVTVAEETDSLLDLAGMQTCPWVVTKYSFPFSFCWCACPGSQDR